MTADITRKLGIPAASQRRSIRFARPVITLALLVAALSALLALAETARLSSLPTTVKLNLAAPETALAIHGFHEPEVDGRLHFRWSAGQSEFRLLNAGIGGTPVLGLRLAGGPPDVAERNLAVDVAGQRVAHITVAQQPRRYLLLIAPDAAPGGRMDVRITSETTSVAPDPRRLGVRVVELTVAKNGASIVWPAVAVLLTPVVTLAGTAFCLRRIGWRRNAIGGGLALVTGILFAAQHWMLPIFAPIYLARLAGAALALAGLTALLLPALESRLTWLEPRMARALWGAALLACAVRLVGTLYPPFDAYDLSLNLGRFFRTIGGTLVDTNRSFEFREGVTVYPSGPYLTLMPGVLLGLTPKLAVQGAIALLDGLGALTTGLLAVRLGQGRQTALIAALAYAALPVMLTSLWFGHTAQVFGQGLMAPLALALLSALEHKRGRAWLLALALLSMALLSHIGVTILALAWLGLAWLFMALQPPRYAWRPFTLMLAAGAIIGLALVYGPAAQLKLAELGKVGAAISSGDDAPAYNLIWRAIQISFYELGWMLALPGMLLLRRDLLPRGGTTLLSAWLAAVLLFWVVEIVTGLQVRYLVFLAPLACIFIGSMLARLIERGPAGALAAWGTLALLLVTGSAPWYIGILRNIQMSMLPLLR